jgi:glycosyltransferase involved in cell wall biosynthesis
VRVIFLSQLLPLPLDAGPKIRAYYVLRHLVAAGHEVTLLCFVRPGDRESDVHELGGLCHRVETVPLERSRFRDVRDGLRSLVSPVPFLVLRDQFPAMETCLQRAMTRQSFDALHVDQLWMAPYAARCARGPLRVLDQHNAVFKVPARLAISQRNPVVKALLTREASKLESYERSTFEAFDRVVWVSDDDREAFAPNDGTPAARHQVIPIAVDPEHQRPVDRPRPFRITFVGGAHWPPNAEGVRWFVERVWPAVADADPECVFTVIGKGTLGQLRHTEHRSRIDVTGYVPNLDCYFGETAAFVVPLQAGAGMRVKILDAWCRALPVVSTTIGAEGIRTRDGDNVLLSDSPEAFAENLTHVLQDPVLARRLAENGRATVEAHYDWRRTYRAWDEVYQ